MFKTINWLIFSALCIIWGSSFILMKAGMQVLSPYQVASLRIFSAGIVLLPFTFNTIKKYSLKMIGLFIITGTVGTLLPAFLFCIAESKVDSGIAGILNALTPICTIVAGIAFFKLKVSKIKILAVFIGFIGLSLLISLDGRSFHLDLTRILYSLLILIATILYGINLNIVGKYMKNVPAIEMVSISLMFTMIPCLFILIFTGYFTPTNFDSNYINSSLYSIILGLFGTSIASIIFYILVKRTDIIFASLVTYCIPFVAIAWGIWYGEIITFKQIICLMIILLGVYLENINSKRVEFMDKRKVKKFRKENQSV